MHVVQRGHDRKACFRDDSDRMVYLVLLKDCLQKARCRVHAYCLMTNHVHLLLTPCDADAFSKLTRNLGQRYVQYFNSRYERTGTLWEGRPYSCLVDSAPYVLGCYRYIELNPVRAGMVTQPAAYAWSSYRTNAGSVEDSLISPHVEYLALSSNVELRGAAYRDLFMQRDDAQFLREVREATNAGLPLVGAEMKARLSAQCERPLERRKPGPRPKDDRGNGKTDTVPLPL